MPSDPFALLQTAMAPRDTMAAVFAALDYAPTPRQSEFHQATEWDVLYGGAAGGGKTTALLAEAIRHCVEIPGLRVGAFRRTYGELEESLLRQLASWAFAEDLNARWNGTKYELTFPNRSLIKFAYAETIEDASRRQGGEYQLLVLDERSLFRLGVVDQIRERLRSGRSDIPVIGIRSSSNPGGADHAAVRARFIEATDYGAKPYTDDHGFAVRFIPAKVDDNPHVDPAYKRVLQAIPDPARRAAMLEGSWDQFIGQYFPEWDRDRHVVPVFELPESWPRFAGVDWGYAAPWAVLWGALDEDGRLWVHRELYGPGVGESAQARRILEAEGGQMVTRYADDSMWTGRGDARSVAEVYAAEGCHLAPAHKGDRVIGWQRVHSYLADGPACPHHRALGWETCPRLHILDGTAPNLVRTLPAQVYDNTRTEDMDSHGDDHGVDALRYMILNLGEPVIDGWAITSAPKIHPNAIHSAMRPPAWWNPDVHWQEVTADGPTLDELVGRLL